MVRWRYLAGKKGAFALSFLLLSCASKNGGPRGEAQIAVAAPELPKVALTPLTPPPAPARPVRILVGGDLLPHTPLRPPEKIRDALQKISPLLHEADASIGNFETAIADPKEHEWMRYSASPEWVDELAAAHFRAVSVANNHACDYQTRGVDDTLASIEKAGILSIGGDPENPWQPRVLFERDGIQVCAVGWTTLMNGGNESSCARSGKIAMARATTEGTKRAALAVFQAKKGGCDAVIAIVHGGDEYEPQTNEVMRQARRVAEVGADAVVVHHPHVPSPVEVVTTMDRRRVPIFASVGNLVTNQGESWVPYMPPHFKGNRRYVARNGWTRLGVVADFSFTSKRSAAANPPGASKKRFAIENTSELTWGYHLIWIENDHPERPFDPYPAISTRLLDPVGDRKIIERLSSDKEGPLALFDDPCWIEGKGGKCR